MQAVALETSKLEHGSSTVSRYKLSSRIASAYLSDEGDSPLPQQCMQGLETLSIPLAISIIKGSLASLGKCLHQLPENYHPLVLLAHFPAIEAEKALLINRGTLQNEFTADTLQYLFDAALKMPTISTLDVSINNLFAHAHMLVTDNVARSFQRALCHFNLEYLAVDGDLLTDPVVMAIAEEIPRQTKLHSIVLARNRWHTPVFSLSAQFFNAVQQCTSLQHLELTEFRGEECVSSWELFKSPLAAALLALPNLRSLSLTRKSIATSDLLALHAKAEQHQQLLPELRSLDLSYNQLGASGARALAPVLSQLSSLEKLKLSMNGCGAQINMPVSSTRRRPSGELSGDGLEALATVFGTLKKLKHIDVTGNPYLSNQGAAALSAAWSGLSNVEHLDMNNCHAFPKGSVSVCSVVSCFTQLTYLDLTSFSLVDGYGNCAGARALADALTHHSSLQHLFLAGTQLTADAVVALAPSISHQRQLQTLDLQFDIEIASRGVIVLSQHISSLSNLRSLALACLDASEEAASALAASLSAVSALRSLNLCHFRTSSDGTDFLCDAFPRLIHLQDLLLADFGHFPASGVAKAVKSMPKLRKLNIGSNPIGDADSRALSTSIQSATSLEWLNVSAQVNICSKSGLEHFIQALDGHPSLQTCILSVADYLELAEELRQPWVRLQ